MLVGIQIMNEEPEYDGGPAVTEDNVLLSCVFSFKCREFLALDFIEVSRICIKYTDGN